MENLLLEEIVLVQEEDLRATPRIGSLNGDQTIERLTIDVFLNHCEWQIESQIVIASCIWFLDPQSVPKRITCSPMMTHCIPVFHQTLVVPAQADQK